MIAISFMVTNPPISIIIIRKMNCYIFKIICLGYKKLMFKYIRLWCINIFQCSCTSVFTFIVVACIIFIYIMPMLGTPASPAFHSPSFLFF